MGHLSAETPQRRDKSGRAGLMRFPLKMHRLIPPSGRPNEYVWGSSEASGDCATARQNGQSDGQGRSHKRLGRRVVGVRRSSAFAGSLR